MIRLFLALLAALVTSAAPAADRPNVVVFLVDDLGAFDFGCCGSRFYDTPHIDQLAREGMRFTTGYANCTVCSPTRAALLTGQYPARLHITDWIEGHKQPFAKLKVPDWTMHLPTETFNLAKAFKGSGYATANVGKWHLGGDEFAPEKQGFDVNVAGTDRGHPGSYFFPYGIANLKDGTPGEFLPERLTRDAIGFIRDHKDKPFFLYFPHYAVHTPVMGKPDVVEKYKKKAVKLGIKQNAKYAALVESVDDSVGAVRTALAEMKLDKNTIVIVTSDNGGLLPLTDNAPLRGGKGGAYEGGVRVPWVVHWPGVTAAGTTDATPVITSDLFPTLVEACALSVPAGHVVDGKSLVPLLKRTGGFERDALYWHYPHYHPRGATPYSAIRVGDYRLVEFFEDHHAELYNLRADVGEEHDLASAEPAKAAELRAKLAAWRASVGAQMPTVNPQAGKGPKK